MTATKTTKREVYESWAASGRTAKPYALWLAHADVALSTIQSWLSGWRRGRNLPAGVKPARKLAAAGAA